MSIRYIIGSLILIYVLIQLLRKKMRLLDGMAFLMPLTVIEIDVGVRITSNQLYLLFMCILLILQIFQSGHFRKYWKGLTWPIVAYLVYMIVDTYIVSTTMIDFEISDKDYLRNEGRFVSQILLTCFSYMVFIIVPNHVYSMNDVLRALGYLLRGTIVLAIIGILQESIFVVSGIDILPLANIKGEFIRRAQTFGYFAIPMIRVCSLGGEPKGLAQILVVGFFILYVYKRCGIVFFQNSRFWLILFFSVIVLTLSTSGFVLWGIFFLISGSLFLLLKIKTVTNMSSIIVVILLLGFGYFYQDTIDAIFEDRVASRDLANEDFDVVIKDFLDDNPEWYIFGSGVGNIHHLASPYIRDEYAYYMENNIFVAKSGYLKQISELGIVGLCLFVFWNLFIFLRFHNLRMDQSMKALFIIGILLFVGYLARVYVWDVYLFILALCNSVVVKSNFSKHKR